MHMMQWRCYYSTNRNGCSLLTLHDQCKHGQFDESILNIQDNFGNVKGITTTYHLL